jgi:hypothetical protein
MASRRAMVAIGCIVHPFSRAGLLPALFTIAHWNVALITDSHHLRLRLPGLRDCC